MLESISMEDKSVSKKDIVIVALEYSRARFIKGEDFDYAELHNYLLREGHITPESAGQKSDFIRAVYRQICSYEDKFKPLQRFMSIESYLGLLDYEELQLARQDSTRAREEARQAIENAKVATELTEKALFWTKISVMAAIIVGIVQIALSINES
jgi:hypothetical protein